MRYKTCLISFKVQWGLLYTQMKITKNAFFQNGAILFTGFSRKQALGLYLKAGGIFSATWTTQKRPMGIFLNGFSKKRPQALCFGCFLAFKLKPMGAF